VSPDPSRALRLTRRLASAFARTFIAVLAFALVLIATDALAGQLTRADIERRFPPPLRVAEKLKDLHAWPLTSELEPEAGPVAYAFESIDLAPIPGFEGTPFNLLVAIDRKGDFMAVEVLRQHEPVFLSGLGPQPLHDFVRQYEGLSLRHEITVGSGYGGRNAAKPAGGGRAVLDGVAKATASVRIVNQTVLASALAVARAKLGFAERKQRRTPPALPVTTGFDGLPPLDLEALVKGGYVARLAISNRELDALFAGTDATDLDEEARRAPDANYATLYVAYLGSPRIGRSLLGDAAYKRLMSMRYHEQHLYWIGSAGRHELLEEGFVPGTSPARLRLAQDGLPYELRDFGGEDTKPTSVPGIRQGRIFQVEAHAGLDPGRPIEVQAIVVRQRGMILPQVTERAMKMEYRPPAELFVFPPAPLPEWLVAWKARGVELAILAVALAGLSLALTRPALIQNRLVPVRIAWLVFVLAFVGWYAQGQLSIVQITGAIKTLRAGYDLSSFLYDPISLLLIAFLPVSFILWGRGPFCGWLCPFGALQEFVGRAARLLRIRQRRLPAGLALALDRGRFVILGVLVVAAATVPAAAERMVEVEPFKTAITVGFDRAWPAVAYAVGLLAIGAVVYKFFCRYLCPLGAFMEIGGLLRRRGWLKRRPECGKPCQVCRHACRYDAIEKTGEIDYRRCHQCLDCVAIHDDPKRCVPLIRMARR
jgi:transcriptional regulator of nitric oxide reductase